MTARAFIIGGFDSSEVTSSPFGAAPLHALTTRWEKGGVLEISNASHGHNKAP